MAAMVEWLNGWLILVLDGELWFAERPPPLSHHLSPYDRMLWPCIFMFHRKTINRPVKPMDYGRVHGSGGSKPYTRIKEKERSK